MVALNSKQSRPKHKHSDVIKWAKKTNKFIHNCNSRSLQCCKHQNANTTLLKSWNMTSVDSLPKRFSEWEEKRRKIVSTSSIPTSYMQHVYRNMVGILNYGSFKCRSHSQQDNYHCVMTLWIWLFQEHSNTRNIFPNFVFPRAIQTRDYTNGRLIVAYKRS